MSGEKAGVPKGTRFTVDADGNLTQDGRWQYSWDAENRLTAMEAIAGVPDAAKKKLEFSYDYMGRRIEKKTYVWDPQSSAYSLQSTRHFIYDGWNLIAELNGNNTLIRSYVWGQDLSGSFQGAGGVGGLLMVTESNGTTHFPAFDGNGNVMALVNADTGAVSAEYEYGPFGEPLRATGVMAKANPFRFSTQYTDQESGLVNYIFNTMDPRTGRWIKREPLGEDIDGSLYGFVWNDPVNDFDILGLFPSKATDPNRPTPSQPSKGGNGKSGGTSNCKKADGTPCPSGEKQCPYNKPTANGCGPENGFDPVPDKPFLLVNFTLAWIPTPIRRPNNLDENGQLNES
jgi:RHS repeat-associated protein